MNASSTVSSHRGDQKQGPSFFQGIDFDEVRGVNVFPFKLQATLAFSSSGNQQGQEFVVRQLNSFKVPSQITVESFEDRTLFFIEDKYDTFAWRGEFSSTYLEEISRKTGREKTYGQFMSLVGTSIKQSQNSEMYQTKTNGGFLSARNQQSYFIDLMGYDDLQLLKARRDYQAQPAAQNPKNNKKYLIFTVLSPVGGDGQQQKVHYPLPLNPVETGAFLMDRDTMKRMVMRMSQTLSEFKSMNSTMNSGQSSGFGRHTAREFFSKENLTHPLMDENQKLREKLRMLEEAKSSRGGSSQHNGGGGALSLHNINAEANRVAEEFENYKIHSNMEVKKLKDIKKDIMMAIEQAKNEINSERPRSAAYSELSYQNLNGGGPPINQTLTSNFHGSNLSEIEELRRQLAESSVELEDSKDLNKRKLVLQQKVMDEYYEQLAFYKNDEKQVRVKVNQLENELDHHLKRLDIICKSKGLPRPQRRASLSNQNNQGSGAKGGSYVSPYRRNGVPSGTQSNGSSAKRPSPGAKYGGYNYTPPNRRPGASSFSPAGGSQGSQTNNKQFRSPLNNNTSITKTKPLQPQSSPGGRSTGSQGSKNSNNSNRMYTPNGRVRVNGPQPSGLYGSQTNGGPSGANRIRREPAVAGSMNANSRSNSRGNSPMAGGGSSPNLGASGGSYQMRKTNYSNQSLPIQNKVYGTSSLNKKSAGIIPKSQSGVLKAQEINVRQTSHQPLTQQHSSNLSQKRNTSLSNNKTTVGQSSTTKILDQHKANAEVNGSIDQKIEKLQSLLKIAKQN